MSETITKHGNLWAYPISDKPGHLSIGVDARLSAGGTSRLSVPVTLDEAKEYAATLQHTIAYVEIAQRKARS